MMGNLKWGFKKGKGSLEKFIVTRSLVVMLAFSIVAVIFFSGRWAFLAGLALGYGTVILKLYAMGRMLDGLLVRRQSPAFLGGLVQYLLRFGLLFLIMVVSAVIDTWMLFGSLAGAIALPIVVMVNGMTEAMGLTHNNFE